VAWRSSGGDNKVRAEKARDDGKKKERKRKNKNKKTLH
jgi:hypothetical protein